MKSIPPVLAARERDVLQAVPMFEGLTVDGVYWTDREQRADVIVWANGFRPAMAHLRPMHLREPDGTIAVDGTRRLDGTRLGNTHRRRAHSPSRCRRNRLRLWPVIGAIIGVLNVVLFVVDEYFGHLAEEPVSNGDHQRPLISDHPLGRPDQQSLRTISA